MTDNEFITLTRDVRLLQKRFDKTRNGTDRDNLNKKISILDKELEHRFKKKDPQQQLFEAI